MDAGYISAFTGLLGASIGGLSSVSTTWIAQSAQLRFAQKESFRTRRETLYRDFITEATRLYGKALSHETYEITEFVLVYALIAQMRLMAGQPVVGAAEETMSKIIETFLAPNLGLNDLKLRVLRGEMNFLLEFGEACRLETSVYRTS